MYAGDDPATLGELGTSGLIDGTPYSTGADYAAYAAARMNFYGANGGMEDTEATADGATVTLAIHDAPAVRATFACVLPDCGCGCGDHAEDPVTAYLRDMARSFNGNWTVNWNAGDVMQALCERMEARGIDPDHP
jgi:hypothetical protein